MLPTPRTQLSLLCLWNSSASSGRSYLMVVEGTMSSHQNEESIMNFHDHSAGQGCFRLSQWLPGFLNALNNSRQANAIAALVLFLWGIAVWCTSMVRRPEMHFNANYIL